MATNSHRPYKTAGEHLASFLLDHYLSNNPAAWDQIAMELLPTGRQKEWVAAVRDMTALNLTRRLIAGGTAIVDAQGEIDAVAEREIKQLILNTMVVDYFVVGDIYGRIEPAIRSARKKIRSTDAAQLRAEAKRGGGYCYLCDTSLEFDSDPNHWTAFTVDHVWPRAYGGDSQPDNFLPACRSCNEKKGDAPSWSMYPVQALVAGYQLTDEKLSTLPKEMRFAVHSRTAVHHATENATSLKEAFISLGRPSIPSVVNPAVSVDIFNLAFSAL